MNRRILIALIALAICLAGLSVFAEEAYEAGELQVYRVSKEEDETVPVRWYKDTPSFPFMGVRAYYRMMFGEELGFAREGGLVTLTAQDGSTAVWDAEKGTLASDDLTKFIFPPKLKGEGHGNLASGLPPYLAVKEEAREREASPTVLDLAAYGIPFYTEEDEIWLPVVTLSDLFETQKNYRAIWNGQNIYVRDSFRTYQNGDAIRQDEHFRDVMKSADPRPADLIDMAYRELCFNLASFYGYPSSTGFSRVMKEKGLDAALAEQDPETRKLLLSADRAEYLTGLNRLFTFLLDDGGHTSFTEYELAAWDPEGGAFAGALEALKEQYDLGDGPRTAMKMAAMNGVKAARKEKFGDASYAELGDTAIFMFDAFRLDLDGWENYYHQGGELPVETDTYAAFHAALDKAAANPEIKNFVIDLSLNSGGESFAMSAMVALVCGESDIRFEDTVNGERTRVSYLTDTNLDGAIDEKDLEVRYDLNFAVLASAYTFSSGNAMASVLSDRGIPVLGERSGGGSCSVQGNGTAEGWSYTISNNIHLINAAGEDIDAGVPVRAELVTVSEDGTRDYSAFYDFDRIRECIR